MNEMKVFENSEFGKLTVIEKKGEPFFIAKEVANILGYDKTSNLTRRLCDDEKDAHLMSTLGGEQEKIIINESGLYNAIFGSKKPEAIKFKKWVTSEILPSIRKHGGYIPKSDSPREIMAKAIKIADSTIKELDIKIENYQIKLEQAKPMIEFAEQVANSAESVELGIYAKAINDANINIGRNKLFSILKEYKYLMEDNIPYQKYIDNGYFEVIEKTYNTVFGDRIYFQTYITGRGQIKIFEKLKKILNA